MLVDVVRMRRTGAKRAHGEVKAATPVRGRLRIVTRPWRESWRPHVPTEPTTFVRLFDHLEDDPIALPLMKLRAAHVNALAQVEGALLFVIVGIERSGNDLGATDEPQAWWCRQGYCPQLRLSDEGIERGR